MLSNRLLTLAKLVDKDSVVADIGSDHGLLPIYLVKEAGVKKAYAIDNKPGPLKHAIENINHYGLSKQVTTSLSNGLDDLASDVNSVVIAGMGYFSIKKILEKSLTRSKTLDSLIIQCNNHLDKLRIYLNDHGFTVIEEVFVAEKNKEYIIFKVKYTNVQSEINPYVSEYLVNQNDQKYVEYLKDRLQYLTEINNQGAKLLEEQAAIKEILESI